MNLLHRFAENEAKISRLYTLYAVRFPDKAKLFQLLAKDESRHSGLISSLDAKLSPEATIKASETAEHIIGYISQFIDKCIEEAETGEPTLKKALHQALSLEQSMVEKKTFDLFETSEPAVLEVFGKLSRETEGHWQGLMKYYESEI